MPLSNVVFHFWLIVEIILTALIIIYVYSSNITSYINLLFDSKLPVLEKINKTFYEPILLLMRMIQPQIDQHALFWFIEIPIAIIIVTIFVIIPLIYDNIDIYKIINNIYRFIVGTRRNNYNFTEFTNNYGNYIPVILALIVIFVFLNNVFGPIFSLIIVFFISIFGYTFLNIIYMFFIKNNDEVVQNIKKYAINDYIFIIIFGMVWSMLLLFLFNSSKSIMDSYRVVA